MNKAWQALQRGAFKEALAAARADAADDPNDIELRFFLAQLLVVAEQPAAALQEMSAFKTADPEARSVLAHYRGLMRSEQLRLDWCARGIGEPAFVAPPPPWVGAYLDAHRALVADPADPERADALLASVRAQIPPAPGRVNGQQVIDVRDADDLLGPFLEALTPQHYLWVPFHQIRAIQIQAPQSYEEVVWLPAEVTLRSGRQLPLSLPSLYSAAGGDDDPHRCGNMTSFTYPSESCRRAMGQKDWVLDRGDGESALVGLRRVARFQAAPEA